MHMEKRPPRPRGRIERVLIVAKTHMWNGLCVSGLTQETNRSIRLLTAHRDHQPSNAPYEVGQVWQIEYRLITSTTPPHVEDVRVMHARYLGQQPNMRKTLLSRVQPWQGDVRNLYDGCLMLGPRSAYITRSGGIPHCSTGYWLPVRPLTLCHIDERAYYEIAYDIDGGSTGTLRIRFVGCAETVPELPPSTLVRVSLARWWKQSDADEERCYLQLSGWYQ